MANKNEARPGVGDTGAGGADTARRGAFFRYVYSTTGRAVPQDKIADFLSEGAENALTARELAGLLHVRRRTITRQIQRARLAGCPICADCDGPRAGYYLPGAPQEVDDYLRRLRHRLAEISETLEAVEQGGERWFREGGGGDD